MKIREWLTTLDNWYNLYSGRVPTTIKFNDQTKDLDYLLFGDALQREEAEKQLKESVTSFIANEYNGRVDRLLKSGVYKHPRYVKLMYAFYKYMNTLGKYRIHTFCEVPEMYTKNNQSFIDCYLHFRSLFSSYARTMRQQAYTGQFPADQKLREEFDHWGIYIRTEMCNDGYDNEVIWKKMVDLLCSLSLIDTMLRDT